MFIGHFAAGFGAKAAAPRTSLGTLFFAAQFVDLLWPVLLLAGVEQVRIAPGATVVTPLDFTHYPYSHSLLAAFAWSLIVGGAYWLARRRTAAAIVVGLLVLSHWFLDLVVHRPDLPLVGDASPHLGFGAWNSLGATLLVEGLLLIVGGWLYLRTTRPRDRFGVVGLWILVGLLLAINAANLSGPPPPSAKAIAWVGQAQWLLVALGWWIDQHRATKPTMVTSKQAGSAHH